MYSRRAARKTSLRLRFEICARFDLREPVAGNRDRGLHELLLIFQRADDVALVDDASLERTCSCLTDLFQFGDRF